MRGGLWALEVGDCPLRRVGEGGQALPFLRHLMLSICHSFSCLWVFKKQSCLSQSLMHFNGCLHTR